MNKVRPDVVISHEFLGVSFQILLLMLFRTASSHILWSAENPEIHNNHSIFRKAVKWFFLLRVNALIVYTDQMASIYQSNYGFQKPVSVVPNIPDTHLFRDLLIKSEPISRLLLDDLNWHHSKIILFVGRLSSEKSVDRLLRAWAGIASNLDNCRVAIVGDGMEKLYLKNLASDLQISNSVFFLGRLDGFDLLSCIA